MLLIVLWFSLNGIVSLMMVCILCNCVFMCLCGVVMLSRCLVLMVDSLGFLGLLMLMMWWLVIECLKVCVIFFLICF